MYRGRVTGGVRICECGCGQEVPRTGSRGPAPRYVSVAHRVRALRERRNPLRTPVVRPCDCGCGMPVRGGRYATKTCSGAAHERRRKALALLPEELGVPVEVPDVDLPSAPTADQVARAVLEARTIGLVLCRLGATAPPALGWRCTEVGRALLDALERAFGKGAG